MDQLREYFTRSCWKGLMLLWTLSHFFITSVKLRLKGDGYKANRSISATSQTPKIESQDTKRMKTSQKRSSKVSNFGFKSLATAYINVQMDALREYVHSKFARHGRRFHRVRIS